MFFSLRAIFDINYDSNTKMCTKDFSSNNLSYIYGATNNAWDSSNQKVKISRAASRKLQDPYNPIYFSYDFFIFL